MHGSEYSMLDGMHSCFVTTEYLLSLADSAPQRDGELAFHLQHAEIFSDTLGTMHYAERISEGWHEFYRRGVYTTVLALMRTEYLEHLTFGSPERMLRDHIASPHIWRQYFRRVYRPVSDADVFKHIKIINHPDKLEAFLKELPQDMRTKVFHQKHLVASIFALKKGLKRPNGHSDVIRLLIDLSVLKECNTQPAVMTAMLLSEPDIFNEALTADQDARIEIQKHAEVMQNSLPVARLQMAEGELSYFIQNTSTLQHQDMDTIHANED